jgi:hypothetical protein
MMFYTSPGPSTTEIAGRFVYFVVLITIWLFLVG